MNSSSLATATKGSDKSHSSTANGIRLRAITFGIGHLTALQQNSASWTPTRFVLGDALMQSSCNHLRMRKYTAATSTRVFTPLQHFLSTAPRRDRASDENSVMRVGLAEQQQTPLRSGSIPQCATIHPDTTITQGPCGARESSHNL